MNAHRWCVLALVAGFVTAEAWGQDDPPEPDPAVGQVVQTIMAQRWEAYEVEEPVTLQRTVRKWRLVEYPIQIDIPQPGPQPADTVICEPTVCCPPSSPPVPSVGTVEYQTPVQSRVDIGVTSTPAPPQPVCIGNRCFLPGLGQQSDVDVDVSVGRRFRLFRRLR